MDRTLNEDAAEKNLQYRADCSNRPSHAISFMSVIASTSGRRETDRSLGASGVQLAQSHCNSRHRVFSSQFKSKVDHILDKTAVLWIMLKIDGAPICSRSHTHPSHTQNSRLLIDGR